ncbi:MAG: hypothetical protein MRZ85_06050, partial [Clostridium sp.]|nr:hypothetical protein [Clostridium sp.]
KELGRKDKLWILKEEYDITEDDNLREDVSEMCNLSQGIKEDGIAIGEAKAQAALIGNMHKNGFTAEQIAAAIDKNIEEVKVILESKE